MQKHTKIYMKFFNYGIEDFIPCEICETRANDIHHIENRGSGGDPKGEKDKIENLMAVCRKCHNEYGDVPELVEKLKIIHLTRMKNEKSS
jgi:5-methylcytosine-specific restriction endonuclease McrA